MVSEDPDAYQLHFEEMYACQRHNALVKQFAFVMASVAGFIVGVAVGMLIS